MSLVRNYYTKHSASESMCNFCSKIVTGTNTTNLWAHVKRHGITRENCSAEADSYPPPSPAETKEKRLVVKREPPEDFSDSNTCARSSISPPAKKLKIAQKSTIDGSQSVSQAGGSTATTLWDSYLFMVTHSDLPLNFCESEGFRHFAASAVPQWDPGRPEIMMKHFSHKFDKLSAGVLPSLQNTPVSLSADFWTDKRISKSLLSASVHFVEETSVRKVVLGMATFDDQLTAHHLSGKIEEWLAFWGIETENVQVGTTGSDEDIVMAMENVVGPEKHFSCFAHFLDSLLNAAISEVAGISAALNRLRNMVSKIGSSCIFFSRKGDPDCAWRSWFEMLRGFFEFLEFGDLHQLEADFELSLQNAEEQAHLKTILQILKPFDEAMKLISQENTTISAILPLAYTLTLDMGALKIPKTDVNGLRLRAFLRERLDQKSQQLEDTLLAAVATLLDPRFLQVSFRNEKSKLKATKFILNKMVEMCDGQDEQREQEEPNPVVSSVWRNFDRLANPSMLLDEQDEPSSVEKLCEEELLRFLSRPTRPRWMNPIALLESEKTDFPNVWNVARLLLAGKGTSLESRSLGDLSDSDPENLWKLAFLRSVSKEDWQKSPLEGTADFFVEFVPCTEF